MPAPTQARWRTVLLSGFRGPGERFNWNGTTWEIIQVVDRAGTSEAGTRPGTIVVIAPASRQNAGERREDPLQDLGAVEQAPTTPQWEGPAELPPSVRDLLPGPGEGPAAPEPNGGNWERVNQIIERILAAAAEPAEPPAEEPLPFDLYDTSGGGGLTFEQQQELERLRQQGSMDLLNAEIDAAARQQAGGAQERMVTNLLASLEAAGYTTPPGALAGIQDPSEIQSILVDLLQSGAVLPTTERLDMIAEAAARPTDIIRLLFLAGGQRPPARRTGEVSAPAFFEQGRESREALARVIAGMPSLTFEDLVDRYRVPAPSIPGAAKGAVVDMKRGADGTYQAVGGGIVVEGPEIFTVGEEGTEFALLAPGSVIAPKAAPDEPETRENAMRAVMEMVTDGKRSPRRALDGAYITEAELPEWTLERLMEGLWGAGVALTDPWRGTSERLQGMQLQMRPSQFVDTEERLQLLAGLHPNLWDVVAGPQLRGVLSDIGPKSLQRLRLERQADWLLKQGDTLGALELLQQAEELPEAPWEDFFPEGATQRAGIQEVQQLIAEVEAAVASGNIQGIQRLGQRARELNWAPLGDLISQLSAGLISPEEFQATFPTLAPPTSLPSRPVGGQRTPEAQDWWERVLGGLQETAKEGTAATNIPFAAIEALPAGAEAGTMATLSALFGSDVMADVFDLFRTGRHQAFESGTALVGGLSR